MINIISNTCLGAYLMRDCFKEEFSNPFIWNIIDFKSFRRIIENYDRLANKNNIVLSTKKEENNYPTVSIKNLGIDIQYVHYKDIKCKNELENSNANNIFLENCAEYALKKFQTRIKRIDKNPIFVIQIQPNHEISGNVKEFIKEFSNLKTKYKVIVFCPPPLIVPNKNIISIPVSENIANTPSIIAKIYCNLIKLFC